MKNITILHAISGNPAKVNTWLLFIDSQFIREFEFEGGNEKDAIKFLKSTQSI